jgi:putative hydrolase
VWQVRFLPGALLNMFDLHCHSLLSDGVLLPSEIAVRYAALGYKTIAISDHADYSNIEQVVSSILEFTKHWPKNSNIKVLPGIELTHLPLEQFKPLAKYARSKGIKIIIGHGETLVEPMLKGTNKAALESDIDILAHPGLITEDDVKLAKKNGIFLEITARHGHRDTNPHVVESALKAGGRLILNNDSHEPEDIISPDELKSFGIKAGLSEKNIIDIYKEVERFLKKEAA